MYYYFRDQRYKKSDPKGKPVACSDEQCPCRPCWVPYYSERFREMRCKTRDDFGCPDAREPKHIFFSDPRNASRPAAKGVLCKRCRAARFQ